MGSEVCSLTPEIIALFQTVAEPTVGSIGNHRTSRSHICRYTNIRFAPLHFAVFSCASLANRLSNMSFSVRCYLEVSSCMAFQCPGIQHILGLLLLPRIVFIYIGPVELQRQSLEYEDAIPLVSCNDDQSENTNCVCSLCST